MAHQFAEQAHDPQCVPEDVTVSRRKLSQIHDGLAGEASGALRFQLGPQPQFHEEMKGADKLLCEGLFKHVRSGERFDPGDSRRRPGCLSLSRVS